MRKLLLLTAATAVALLLAAPAHANTITMKVTDGTTTFLIDDGDTGGVGHAPDANPTAGAITFVGAVGSWSINVSTGEGSGITSGIPTAPQIMDLNSLDTAAGASPTTLTILFTETFTTPTDFGLLSLEFGGTLTGAGTVEYAVFGNDTGTAYDNSVADRIGTSGALGTSPFAFSGVFPTSGLLNSLTQELVITASTGALTFSGDAKLAPGVPEPASLFLLGTGLVGVASATRKRFRKGA